jgi:hypothetical protein
MKPFRLTLLLFLCSFAGAADSSAPAQNWVLPLFTDKEGYRTLTARGSDARAVGDKIYRVTNLNVIFFSGDAAARTESVFLSPLATFSAADKRVYGDKGVRIVRDDLEASGMKWTYDHQAEKHVTLEGNVEIVFNAGLKDLLK